MSVTIGLSYCPARAAPLCKEGRAEILATKQRIVIKCVGRGRVLARVSVLKRPVRIILPEQDYTERKHDLPSTNEKFSGNSWVSMQPNMLLADV